VKHQTILLSALAALLVLSTLATGNGARAAPSPPEGGWVTLMSEDFEGVFPSALWHIGREGDPYLWGQRYCNPHGGVYSMWAGGGGSLGSQIPCTGMYTTSYVTTLSYGPFDLSGCTDVRVNFAHWSWLGAGDWLGVGYSIDGGKVWHLVSINGDAVSVCGGWCEESFNKGRWTISLCGQPNVYLLFRFSSDAEGVSYGTFVDDVSLEAYYESALPTPSTTATPTGTATVTRTATPTATRTPTPILTPGASKSVYLPLVVCER
jgi:hypothetical protein